ncbi:MAG: hypothetical protein AB1659_00605, partial [Thermodesulfobacteriota bacterium]
MPKKFIKEIPTHATIIHRLKNSKQGPPGIRQYHPAPSSLHLQQTQEPLNLGYSFLCFSESY